MHTKRLLSIIGLLFNLTGAICLAFSIRVFDPMYSKPGVIVEVSILGNNVFLVSKSNSLILIGISFLIAGFSLQLLSEFKKK